CRGRDHGAAREASCPRQQWRSTSTPVVSLRLSRGAFCVCAALSARLIPERDPTARITGRDAQDPQATVCGSSKGCGAPAFCEAMLRSAQRLRPPWPPPPGPPLAPAPPPLITPPPVASSARPARAPCVWPVPPARVLLSTPALLRNARSSR